MNLEDLNNEYLRLSAATKNHSKQKEQLENELKKAKEDKNNAEKNLVNAKKTKNNKQIKTFQNDVNDAITKIEEIKLRLVVLEKLEEKNQEEIQKIIEEVKARPEVMEQCNRAMDIRTERQIAKYEKQKKEQEEKKKNIEEFKKLIDKLPDAKIMVNNIENKSFEINKKQTEIKSIEKKISELDPKDPNYATDKAKLDGDKAKIEGEKTVLVAERKAERDKLKKRLNNPKYNETIDNLTTGDALDKDIRNCDRLIKRSENKIHDYEYARDSLYNTNSNPQSAPQGRWGKFKNAIKNLFSKRKGLPQPQQQQQPAGKSFKDEIKLDSNVMKFDVVKDIYKETLDKKVEDGKNER